jgi:hypothetical protein
MRVSPPWVLVGCLLCGTGCASASAEEPNTSAATAPLSTPAPTAPSRVMRSEAAREALRAHLRASLARGKAVMAVEQRADGVRVSRHGGGFQHATLVVRDANGERSQSCTDDLGTAETALLGKAP